jgi:hypothetical protein
MSCFNRAPVVESDIFGKNRCICAGIIRYHKGLAIHLDNPFPKSDFLAFHIFDMVSSMLIGIA